MRQTLHSRSSAGRFPTLRDRPMFPGAPAAQRPRRLARLRSRPLLALLAGCTHHIWGARAARDEWRPGECHFGVRPPGRGSSSCSSNRPRSDTKLGILSEEYDQASAHEAVLQTQISSDSKAFAAAQLHVSHDQTALQSQAVAAYVAAGSAWGSRRSSRPPTRAPCHCSRRTSRLRPATSMSRSSSLQNSEIALNARRVALSQAETAAVSTARTLSNARSNEIGLENSLHNTLSGVQGNLAAAVRAQELAAEAEAARQAAAAAAAARAAAQPAQATYSPRSVLPHPAAGLPQ